MIASTTRQVKIDRTSYRRNATPFGFGIFPPESPAAPLPPIRPSELMAQIKDDLARIAVLQQRQQALVESLRNPLPPVCGGSPEPTDKDLDALYEECAYLDRIAFIHRDPEDQLI